MKNNRLSFRQRLRLVMVRLALWVVGKTPHYALAPRWKWACRLASWAMPEGSSPKLRVGNHDLHPDRDHPLTEAETAASYEEREKHRQVQYSQLSSGAADSNLRHESNTLSADEVGSMTESEIHG